MSEMLKIGLFGVGHLGKIHLRCIQELQSHFQLIGFFDPDDERASDIENNFHIKRFHSEQELMIASDVVDIVTPTPTHYQLAMKAIENGKHIFIEKPITSTPNEARSLLSAAKEKGIKGQIGFVERFNPAFLAIADENIEPMFIEAHRLAGFNPRGTDVSVVLDLMIHDLDIVLKLVNKPVKNVFANGVAIVSSTEDIANARIEFENGAVANITASRISLKNMRKFRLFSPKAYISMDFLDKKTEIISLSDVPNDNNAMELETALGKKYLKLKMPEIADINAIKEELKLFANAVNYNSEPTVSLQDGVLALELAYIILEEIKNNKTNNSNILR